MKNMKKGCRRFVGKTLDVTAATTKVVAKIGGTTCILAGGAVVVVGVGTIVVAATGANALISLGDKIKEKADAFTYEVECKDENGKALPCRIVR
jgi:phage-related tail protein